MKTVHNIILIDLPIPYIIKFHERIKIGISMMPNSFLMKLVDLKKKLSGYIKTIRSLSANGDADYKVKGYEFVHDS